MSRDVLSRVLQLWGHDRGRAIRDLITPFLAKEVV